MLRTYAESGGLLKIPDWIYRDSGDDKISPRYCQEQSDGRRITMVDVYADIVTGCIFMLLTPSQPLSTWE